MLSVRVGSLLRLARCQHSRLKVVLPSPPLLRGFCFPSEAAGPGSLPASAPCSGRAPTRLPAPCLRPQSLLLFTPEPWWLRPQWSCSLLCLLGSDWMRPGTNRTGELSCGLTLVGTCFALPAVLEVCGEQDLVTPLRRAHPRCLVPGEGRQRLQEACGAVWTGVQAVPGCFCLADEQRSTWSRRQGRVVSSPGVVPSKPQSRGRGARPPLS